MPIEIPFMSAIFGMFTQFINAHMTIYRNLTPNITKGQKRVKKGPKQVKKKFKIKNAHTEGQNKVKKQVKKGKNIKMHLEM